MITSIPAAWRTNLDEGGQTDRDERLHIDFRGVDYPDLGTGSAVYTLAREDNLIDRGNCESATAPMMLGETVPVTSNATWARSSDFARSGDYSYKITKTIAAGTVGYATPTDNINTADMHGIVPGETVEVSAWVYVPTAGGPSTISEAFMYVQYYDLSAAGWQTASSAAATYDAWNKLSASVTLSTDASGFRIIFYIANGASSGEYFYVDDIKVTRHSVPGSHYLSGGYTEHLVEMPSQFSFRIKFRPTFAYDTASVQYLFGWRVSDTQEFRVNYYPTGDQFIVVWEDGGTQRSMASAQYDNGTSYRNINQWTELVGAIDLTTGTTAGSAIWLNKTQDDTSWSGIPDTPVTKFPRLQWRAYNGTAGAFDIAYAELFLNYILTDAEVQADFKTVYCERVYFDLNGHGTGRTRCLIPKGYVQAVGFEKGVANRMSGAHSANTFHALLNNNAGEFSDDQYAAFDPELAQYNGTVTQKYLQRRCRVWVEDWYDGDWDSTFYGRITPACFARQTQFPTVSVVSMSAMDTVETFQSYRISNGGYYEDDKISDATEADSLFHQIAKLARPKIYNYLSNSSFENATITNSWVASGGTWSRQANPFIGTYCGRLVPGAGTQYVYQYITFDGIKKLNVGETYTFYVWLLSSAAATGADNWIRVQESDSGGANDSTDYLYTLAGGEGWVKCEVSHTITDSASDRLYCYVSAAAGDTVDIDEAHLVHGDRALQWRVLNDNDGSSGAESAEDADYAQYDTFGIDADYVATVHPWKRVDEGDSVWTHLKSLADASASSYVGMDECGTLKFRAVLATGYSDPVPHFVIDDSEVEPGFATNLTMAQANKIVGHGVKIVKDDYLKAMWFASATKAFATDSIGYIAEVVANGDTWPDPATYGVFWAQYDPDTPHYKFPESDPVAPDPWWATVIERVIGFIDRVLQGVGPAKYRG